MTANPHEHKIIYVEVVEHDGQAALAVTPAAIDLTPGKDPTVRTLDKTEAPEDMTPYIANAKDDMNKLADQLIENVINVYQKQPVQHYGYPDLTQQLQEAPHLLLANLTAALIASCAQDMIENPDVRAELSAEDSVGMTASVKE